MANNTDIERLNYYEGEYLGAVDFEAEQEYRQVASLQTQVSALQNQINSGPQAKPIKD